jgi:sterol desaturase/sphingolipid hydroxylase (fatty acid hydroxylase superfamily)
MRDETTIRLLTFVGVLTALAIAEAVRPRRRRLRGRGQRWPHNLGLVAAGTVVMRVVAPAGVVTFALLAERRGWGLLRQVDAPTTVGWVIGVLALDLAVYGQHVAMHKVPWLWPLHRVHHADVDVDVTTGVRFHPVEFLLSLGLKGAVAIVVGMPAGAVILFEVLLNATSMFSHANLRLPAGADRIMRRLVVTPDMHRVHHSRDRRETDSNYGFNVPWWDRIFGTYRAAPLVPHEQMTLGVDGFDAPAEQRLDRLLTQPLRLSGRHAPPGLR